MKQIKKWICVGIFSLYVLPVFSMAADNVLPYARLSIMIYDSLIKDGFCELPGECNKLIFFTTARSKSSFVEYTFHGIAGHNGRIFGAIVGYFIRDGIRLSGGMPIRIYAYRESYDEYLESGIFWKSAKPFLTLEIEK